KHDASEKFIHRYDYNTAGMLVAVYTSENGQDYKRQAQYSYYADGKLKRTVLANNLQGIDYTYTLSGALKGINHPSLSSSKDPGGDANDIFGMTLDYYEGDYRSTLSDIRSLNYGADN